MVKSPVHISKMTGKLDSLRSISTNTVTNRFCNDMHNAKAETICKVCYSHAMLNGFRKNCQASLQRNSDLLSKQLLSADELPVIKDKVFRFNAHGELINMRHLLNLIAIVRHNPDTLFTLWTKRKDLINRLFKYELSEKPDNMILIFSNPKVSNIIPEHKMPKHFDKTFNNVLEHEAVQYQNCTGQQCKDCLLCYTHGTTPTIVEKVKAY